MSTSTVSITANTAGASRRRPVVIGEKKSGFDLAAGTDGIAASPVPAGNDKGTSGDTGKDLSHSIRGEIVLERSRDAVQLKKSSVPPNSTAPPVPRRTTARKAAAKSEKPRWQTVVSVFTKNFLLLMVLLLLAQMIRRLALNNSQGSEVATIHTSDYEGRMAEMESFVKTTTKMMQVQVEVVDRKIENEIAGLRNEFGRKIEENGLAISSQLNMLDGRVESIESLVGDREWLAKDDFEKFVEDFKNAKGEGELSLDEVRAFAKEIVEKEIEKHAADGLGMVDYALASGGALVVKHSEPFFVGKAIPWLGRNGVHSDAGKMLRPSFGQPGECFPLKGSNGFVNIRLRTAIVPEAITLEHVAKSVAYDRSSAPKECRIYGWLGGIDTVDDANERKMVLLTQFTYDLEKTNAQTFRVSEESSPGVVDRICLHFSSNHGSPTHTCIYRLRVHGHLPNSVPTLAVQS